MIVGLLTFTLTQKQLAVKTLFYIEMLSIFSTPELIRNLWQLKTFVFSAYMSNMCYSIVFIFKVYYCSQTSKITRLFNLL